MKTGEVLVEQICRALKSTGVNRITGYGEKIAQPLQHAGLSLLIVCNILLIWRVFPKLIKSFSRHNVLENAILTKGLSNKSEIITVLLDSYLGIPSKVFCTNCSQ